MTRRALRMTWTAFAVSCLSGPALAELTADEVWTGLANALKGYGYSVTGTERATSNGMELTDVTMVIELPESTSRVAVAISEINLAENRDGSILMTFPERMPIAISAKPDGEDPVDMVLDYTNSGLEVTVSGAADDLTYDYMAERISMVLTELRVNEVPVGRQEAQFRFGLEGVSGSTNTKFGTGTEIAQSLQSERATYHFAFRDPETEDSGLVSGAMANVSVTSAMELPEGFDSSDPASLTDGGFSATGQLRYENGEMQFAADDGLGTNGGSVTSAAVTLDFAMTGDRIAYSATARDQAFNLSGPELPVPVAVTMAESGFNMTIPVAQADMPQDAALGLTLGGFEMSSMLWNMLDPGGALPRDPATIALDLAGQVTPFINLFDPAAMARAESEGTVPAELNALTLNGLTVSAAGAKISGQGAFTFDNSDLVTFGGMPKPTGGMDLTIDGANGLIDKLIAMGLLTREDAMGARMMMSMFAVPGDGEDSLKSSLQINEQGHVLANGMRIQ